MNLSMEPNYKEKIESLRVQVGEYDSNIYTKSFLPEFNFSSPYMLSVIPIIIIILFLLLSPVCIKDENVDEKGQPILKVSYKKLFIWTLSLSVICIIGIFGYYYKQKTK